MVNLEEKIRRMKYEIEKKHISIGIVSFAVMAACIILYFILYRMHGFMDVVGRLVDILMPFAYGLVMAYLLCPLYNWTFEKVKAKHIFPPNSEKRKKAGKKDRNRMFARVIATIVSMVTMSVILAGLMWMVIPGVIDSITGLAKTLPDQINTSIKWLDGMVDQMNESNGVLADIANAALDAGSKWVETTILPGSETVITVLSTHVLNVLAGIKNFMIGIIICVFFLNSKDTFAAQARKICYATFKNKNADKVLYGAHFINITFGKFINGKLIDSLIIGIICFVFMTIVDWPYVMLISVIIGVTNIIPFFGPFIGAIPSALLILIVDPITCFYFIIFIFALQQLDGNIIGPKILGESIGIPSFWIMFAIIVGGGMFGFVGMVLGVPVFACIYAYIKYKVGCRLENHGMSKDTKDYRKMKGNEGYIDEKNS